MSAILGAILAGGRSRRFGSDKALALLDGQSLIGRVAAGLKPQTEALVVCGRTVDDMLSLADRPGPDLGPLAGLNSALHHARRNGYDAVVSVPCDTPLLPDDLVRRLAAAGPASYAAAIPVIGLWPSSLGETLGRHLATSSDRSMRRWIAIAGAVPVEIGIVVNINTAADLAALQASGR